MWAAFNRNRKPYKELVKIAHPPIIRHRNLMQSYVQWMTIELEARAAVDRAEHRLSSRHYPRGGSWF
jgi:hypothetical protein